MNEQDYTALHDQVARQTPELAALDAQIVTAQPIVDALQATADAAQVAFDEADDEGKSAAKVALDAALQALTGPKADLGALTAAADPIRAAIAQCQAEMQASGLTVDTDAVRLADSRTALVLKIDAEADEIRNAVIGGRATEYLDALADAEAFQAASFTDTVPSGVTSWLDAKNAVGANWTAQQAAEDILATGSAWKSAQSAIRTHRLLRKEQIKAATTSAAQKSAFAAWTAFTVAIRSQLGL